MVHILNTCSMSCHESGRSKWHRACTSMANHNENKKIEWKKNNLVGASPPPRLQWQWHPLLRPPLSLSSPPPKPLPCLVQSTSSHPLLLLPWGGGRGREVLLLPEGMCPVLCRLPLPLPLLLPPLLPSPLLSLKLPNQRTPGQGPRCWAQQTPRHSLAMWPLPRPAPPLEALLHQRRPHAHQRLPHAQPGAASLPFG